MLPIRAKIIYSREFPFELAYSKTIFIAYCLAKDKLKLPTKILNHFLINAIRIHTAMLPVHNKIPILRNYLLDFFKAVLPTPKESPFITEIILEKRNGRFDFINGNCIKFGNCDTLNMEHRCHFRKYITLKL